MDPILLLFIPIFLLSLTVHEFAHAWTAKQGGDLTSAYLGRVSLNPLVHIDPVGTVLLPALLLSLGLVPFGWAKPVPVNTVQLRRSIWMVYVAVAGPISNVLLVMATVLVMKVFQVAGFEIDSSALRGGGLNQSNILWTLGLLMVQINVVLALFNMMPIPPLDGSRVVYHFFVRDNPSLQPAWFALEGFAGIMLVWIAIMLPPVRATLFWLYSMFYNLAVWPLTW